MKGAPGAAGGNKEPRVKSRVVVSINQKRGMIGKLETA